MAITDLKATGKWNPGAKRWQVDYRDSSGRRKRKRFALKADAAGFDAELRLDNDGVRDRAKGSLRTVDEAHADWIAWLRVHGGRSHDGASPSTLGGYESIHAQWIAPSLGTIRLGRLARPIVDEWRTTMQSRDGKQPSPRQRDDAESQLVRLLNWCMNEGLLGENVAKTRSGARHPRPKARKTKAHIYLNNRQVWRLAAHAPDETTRNIVLVMATTGLRFGEVAALEAGDFTQRTGELVVSKALAMDGGKVYLARTKSHEDRTVQVQGWILKLLQSRASGLKPGDLLFATVTGRRLNRDNWASRKFAPAAESASTAIARLQQSLGVSEYQGRRAWFGPLTAEAVAQARQFRGWGLAGIGERQFDTALNVLGETAERIDLREGDTDFDKPTPHDMRHTAASIAIASGASVKAVQSMLGHASAKMTLDTYAGLFDSERESVANAMAVALSAPA